MARQKKMVTRKFSGGGFDGHVTYDPEFGFVITVNGVGSRMAFFLIALAEAANEAVRVAQAKETA